MFFGTNNMFVFFSFVSSRHIIFAPSSHNKYAGESFPGIYDALFDIDLIYDTILFS